MISNPIHYGTWEHIAPAIVDIFPACGIEGEDVTFDGCDVTCPSCLKIIEENEDD